MKDPKQIIKDKLQRSQQPDQLADEKVPRITNKTISDHREEVLSGARKLIYPLQHPTKYIIVISTALIVLAVVIFFTTTTLALYRYQTTSNFMYRVTQVVPFPIARLGNTFVAYENYLFELRQYVYYYENQQSIDFDTEVGAQQLDNFRQRALDKVINDAYIKRIAQENNISVSDHEVEEKISLFRRQERIGASNQELEDVLREFWDWSLDDFRRSLASQLLAQRVVAELDTDTQARAQAALAEIEAGEDFEAVVAEYSDDPATIERGGELGLEVTRLTREIAPQTVEVLSELEVGETSGVINIGYALQIVKLLEREGDTYQAAHILFTLEDIETYVNEAREAEPARVYLQLPDIPDIDVIRPLQLEPEPEIEAEEPDPAE